MTCRFDETKQHAGCDDNLHCEGCLLDEIDELRERIQVWATAKLAVQQAKNNPMLATSEKWTNLYVAEDRLKECVK